MYINTENTRFLWLQFFLLQLYDRISSKVVSPVRAPPSDGVLRCREALDALAILEHRPDVDINDVEELRDILSKPHSRVSPLSILKFPSKKKKIATPSMSSNNKKN